MNSGMTRKPAGMSPLQDLGPGAVRHEEAVPWTSAGVRLGALGPLDDGLDVHGDGPDHLGSREDGSRGDGVLLHRMDSGQCVGLGVLGSWLVCDVEVKPAEEQGPARLAGVAWPYGGR